MQIANSIANELIKLSKIKTKKFYDKKIVKIDLNIGDSVIVTNEDKHKLQNLYSGPYTVTKLLDKNIELYNHENNKVITVHKNRVRKYTK